MPGRLGPAAGEAPSPTIRFGRAAGPAPCEPLVVVSLRRASSPERWRKLGWSPLGALDGPLPRPTRAALVQSGRRLHLRVDGRLAGSASLRGQRPPRGSCLLGVAAGLPAAATFDAFWQALDAGRALIAEVPVLSRPR